MRANLPNLCPKKSRPVLSRVKSPVADRKPRNIVVLQDFNFCFSDCKKAQAQLRMGDEREEVDACEQAKAKVEERLYRVTVIERILASKGIQTVEKRHKILGKSPFTNFRNAGGGASAT